MWSRWWRSRCGTSIGLLQSHLDARGDGDAGEAITVASPDGSVVLGQRRLRTRRIVSLFGEARIDRVGYSASGQTGVYPLGAELGLGGRCWSPEVCLRVVRAAVCGPFAETVASPNGRVRDEVVGVGRVFGGRGVDDRARRGSLHLPGLRPPTDTAASEPRFSCTAPRGHRSRASEASP